MPQLVFVHGVATRADADYALAVANRNTFYRELVFDGNPVDIYSPMWGTFVAPIPPEVFQTNTDIATFSLNLPLLTGLDGGLGSTGGKTSDLSIVALGQQDPVAALDAICSEIADKAMSQKRPLSGEELQAFRNAFALIASEQSASLFPADATAQSVSDRLKEGTDGTFSIGSAISNAISAVTGRISNAASTLGFDAVRGSLSPAIGLFMGDVFVYLKEGKTRNAIQDVIRGDLMRAYSAKKAAKGPLIVVGHSMGGVILTDMLTNPEAAGLPKDIEVDALFTVGSQPGLFAALGVLSSNLPAGSPRRRPECVKHWFNVFDPIDPLAFRADMIYAGAEDVMFNSVAGITDTHSKYFQRPQFYARTRARLKASGIL
ncbi:MAG: hypothetical protein JO014_18330 [Metakosakonia sp.]|nr:hypothetical protein [Phytobacter sp.]MBV8874662.1 hypothetical protein [Phytobacter sp.]